MSDCFPRETSEDVRGLEACMGNVPLGYIIMGKNFNYFESALPDL